MAQKKPRRGQRKISAWSRGEKRNDNGLTFQEIGRISLRLINSRRCHLTRCNAMAKSTGMQCKQPAMANGKCRFHGGKTPKADEWHVIQADVSGHKTSMARFDRKLERAEKARKARRLRLLRATEIEREQYEKWLWARPAGSVAKRAARRAETRMNRRIAEERRELTLGLREETADPEIRAIEIRLAELKAQVALRKASKSGVFE